MPTDLPYGPQQSFDDPLPEGEMGSGMVSYLNPGATHPSQVPTHTPESDHVESPHFQPPNMPDFGAIQSAIQAQQSPYVTMGAHGWLQDNHPKLAGVLDNAFLAAAMTPGPRGPEGAGGGISRTFEGLMGARQAHMQHDISQATLPLQLSQQQLGFQKGIMDLYKTGAEIQHYHDQGEYWKEQAQTNKDWREGRLGQLGNSTGNVIVDDKGEPWSQGKAGQGLVYAGNNPNIDASYQPTFTKHGKSAQAANNLWSHIQTLTDPNAPPDAKAQAQQGISIYTGAQAAVAGGRKAATDKAGEPQQTANDFLKSEKDRVAASLGKRPSESEQKDFLQDYYLKHMNDAGFDSSKVPSLESRQKDFDQKAAQTKTRLSRYVQSNDWRKGRQFDPDQYGDAPQTSLAPTNTNPYR
jgi:hypothetical protein